MGGVFAPSFFVDTRRILLYNYFPEVIFLDARKTFSRIGFATLAFLIASDAASICFALLFEAISPGALENSDVEALVSFLSVDLIGVGVFWLVVRKLRSFRLSRERMDAGELFVYFIVCVFVSLVGAILGVGVSDFLSGGAATDYAAELLDNPGLFTVFSVAAVGPVVEEIAFRKLIIDRTVQFGEKNAVLFSAMIFGLMHGNFYQAFYAFGIGLVFGYIYTRSGKIRYTIILHIIFNLICGVLPSYFPDEIFLSFVEMASALLGLIFIIVFRRKIRFRKTLFELSSRKAFGKMCINVGMILFFAAAVFEFVYSLM